MANQGDQPLLFVAADTESHADHGRFTNAIELAKEAKEQGDDVRIIFDGAGTRWIPELSRAEGGYKWKNFAAVRDVVAGACAFCAGAFGVKEAVKAAGIPLLSDYEGHPSLRGLIAQGYQVITF